MSTGGFALLLSVTPHKFSGLETIGKIVYILDLVIFVLLCTGLLTRFLLTPSAFRRSLQHPTEALFMPTFWLCLPTIIGGMQKYGVPSVGAWLLVTERVLFWTYVACTLPVACAQYWYLFSAKQMPVAAMMPSWILPVFPAMLGGTVASLIAADQPAEHAMPIIVAGVTLQGLGMMVSFMLYSIFIGRLMENGLPDPNVRPGMFIAVGPPAFTALALIGMSNALPDGYGYFASNTVAVPALQVMALFTGIFLWTLAWFWFVIALVSVLLGVKEMSFHLVW